MHLYGFVENNSISSVDFIGLLLVGVDGTGSAKWRPKNGIGSHVYNFVNDYSKNNLDGAKYFDGPASTVTGSDWRSIRDNALGYICASLKSNPKQPVFLIGYSRGGFIATEIARSLRDNGCPCVDGPIKVNFLGLYDSVDRASGGDSSIPDSVEVARHALRNSYSRPYFSNTNTDFESGVDYSYKKFDTNHGGIGGVPLDGDFPVIIEKTHKGVVRSIRPVFPSEKNIDESNRSDVWMRDQARLNGVPIP